jgi:hypothetical protein
VAELVVRHDIKVEPHHQYGFYGKAELLDPCLREGREQRDKEFRSLLDEEAQKQGKSADHAYYIKQSPKRSQREFGARFFPTAFPNGNVYGDSQCTNGTFMGNINERPLKQLIKDFSNTLPGHILLSKDSNCERFYQYLPQGIEDECDYCRNHPLESMPTEAIGRKKEEINPDKLKIKPSDRELLLSFALEEKHLNMKTGRAIAAFLTSLEDSGQRFVLSRPLPRCILGADYEESTARLGIPRNCMDCRELFTIREGIITSCRYIDKKGPHLQYMQNRSQIGEYFNTLRLKKGLSTTCADCIYQIRKQCEGMCFRTDDASEAKR